MIIPPQISLNNELENDDNSALDLFEQNEKVIFSTFSDGNEITVADTEQGRFLKFGHTYQSGVLNFENNPQNMPNISYYYISCILNPRIKNILILGMGSGYFIKGFLKLIPDLKRIDVVEFDPLIIDIVKEYFDYKPDKKVKINIQDARVFVRNSKTKYDLIIMDLFSQEGMSYRFMTKEFLEEVNSALTPDGIFSSNLFGLLTFDQNDYIFNSMLKTYKTVFNEVLTIPTSQANKEIYRDLFKLKHSLPDLTNIILFASNKQYIKNKDDLSIKTANYKKSKDVKEIEKIDKYVQDLIEFNINLDNCSVLLDEWEYDSRFTIKNLKKFLYTDHVNNNQSVSINPMDDEGLIENTR